MINNSDLFNIMDDWNYWSHEPKGLGIPRTEYLSRIAPILDTKEVIVIKGVRRSGKSTFLRQLIANSAISKKQFLYVNFDDYRFYEFLSLELLENIISTYRERINPDKKAYVILDEVQAVDGWEKFIKTKYDLEEELKFIVSGSNSNLMSKEFSLLLTGRVESIDFFPFSFKEYLRLHNVEVGRPDYFSLKSKKNTLLNNASKYIEEGGFPEPLKREEKKAILNEYFTNILEKDIILRNNIRDSTTIKQLALHLLSNVTGGVNLTSLKDYFKISINTLKAYLSCLEEGNILFLLYYFSFSTKTQNLMPKKAYCIDNGLRNAVSFKFSKDYGKLAENMVFVQLKRKGKEVYYWKDGGEIDFIVKEKAITAINVTYTDDVNEREVKPLKSFRAKRKIVITRDTYKKKDGIEFIPLWLWLLEE